MVEITYINPLTGGHVKVDVNAKLWAEYVLGDRRDSIERMDFFEKCIDRIVIACANEFREKKNK